MCAAKCPEDQALQGAVGDLCPPCHSALRPRRCDYRGYVATARRHRMPRNASEALAYVEAELGDPGGDYEVAVRPVRPDEPIDGQSGVVFEVLYIWMDSRGVEVYRVPILVMDDGYRLRNAPTGLRPTDVRIRL